MLSDSTSKVFVNLPSRTNVYSSWAIANALRLIWILIILLGELGSVYWSLARCRWPSIRNSMPRSKPTRVLLISDTQVQARPPPSHSGVLFPFRRAFLDLTLRKHWHIALHLNPDVVIFLGDMLANGKGAHSREEYEVEVGKFNAIFDVNKETVLHYVPGNEDVGLGSIASISNNLRSYFTASFGPVNSKFIIANHTFIGLDAPGLVDEDYHRHANHVTFDDWTPIPHGSVEFVKEVSNDGLSNIILLSHIPLSRPETASCGPDRERGGIRRSAGPGYQSMLGKHTTSFLLKALEPLVVFSGDNHDYCDYTHVVPDTHPEATKASKLDKSIQEITIKSFSNSPHIKRPGFQLLSLIEPSETLSAGAKTFADRSCLLPDQHGIYLSIYLPGFCLTFIVLLVLQFRNQRTKKLRTIDTSSSMTTSTTGSGRSTPALHVEADPAQLSATWSPYSPIIPTSPRTTLPSGIRTPHSPSVSTTRFVASVPGSPAPSSPVVYHVPIHGLSEDAGDDDDMMYPAQYITHRDSYTLRQRDDDEWSHVRVEEDFEVDYRRDDIVQDLLISPSNRYEFNSALFQTKRSTMSKKAWSWSYTFVLKGRRRRFSLSFPSWGALNNLLEFSGFSSATLATRRRRYGVIAFTLSVLSVIWPAAVVWAIINGLLF